MSPDVIKNIRNATLIIVGDDGMIVALDYDAKQYQDRDSLLKDIVNDVTETMEIEP